MSTKNDCPLSTSTDVCEGYITVEGNRIAVGFEVPSSADAAARDAAFVAALAQQVELNHLVVGSYQKN